MAERKAVNKYYPPDWTPDKGSINKYVGQHPLRERAKKISQGIMVIRFELPYNIWCGGCGSHVGMGVRYNAEKKKVGNYYSTPIYRFRMKCHLCDNYFEIETDPKNCEYNVVNGARRKNEQWEPSATETVETTDKEDAKRMAIDAMFKLEHGVEDVQKSKKVAPVLHQLQEVQSVWKDDYAANKLLRKKFRGEKKNIAEIKLVDDQLRKKGSLDISLLPERPEDVEHAKKIRFYSTGFSAHKHKKRREIQTRSWFGTESATSTKLPELPLRKRKGSSTEKNDDWKKSVLKRTSSFSPDKDNSALNTPTSEHVEYRVCNAGSNGLAGSECSREKEASENDLRTEGNYQEDMNDTSLDTQCTNGSLSGNCSLNNGAAESSLLVSSLYSSDTSADDDDTND